MINLISLAAAMLLGASTLLSGAGAGSVHNFSTEEAGADLIFAQIVEQAVEDCREELSTDVFANFRLQSCVETKVSEFVATAGAPQLAEFAAANRDYLVTATLP